eukprot:463301_1
MKENQWNEIRQNTIDSVRYGMSESTFNESQMYYQVSNHYQSSPYSKQHVWQFADYSIHKEKTENFTKKAFVIKMFDNVFASYCICNNLDQVSGPEVLILEQGQITMISFLCKHHKHWNYMNKTPARIEAHLNPNACWNNPTFLWELPTAQINPPKCHSMSFSKILCHDSLCKNCRLKAASIITHSLHSKCDTMQNNRTIHGILYIHYICKLIAFVLESGNTAKHILCAKKHSLSNILYFISIAIDGIIAFFAYSICGVRNDFQYSMFDIILESFRRFLFLLLQHSSKLKTLKLSDKFKCRKICIAELPYKINKLIDMFLPITHDDKVFSDIILPLVVLLLIFDREFKFRHIDWRKSIVNSETIQTKDYQRLLSLLHSNQSEFDIMRVKCTTKKRWIEYLKSFPVYFVYLNTIHANDENVECQWRKCKNTKNSINKTSTKKTWKKCKGCRVARYCCRRCQKLDWKFGFHKKICKILLTAPAQFN